jgi:peptidoglycan/LPS O-acetylase OafA/YrhL
LLTIAESPRAAARPVRQERRFLPEVQALRALAVSLVVLYHFWPNRLQGGFVGVDVFFVISGFLITSHLHREVETTGRIGLAQFYARRARRLLPAALLVLMAGAAAAVVFLPIPRWSSAAGELLASALYGQNWLLAGRAVDYSASQEAASPFQHFWSLSVEEQFYLLWPPLILLLLFVARRLATSRRDGVLLAGILAVSAASLAWSVHFTATDQAAAYFTTPTRIWELGAGAALALAVRMRGNRPGASPVVRVALRWAGAAAITASALVLSAASPFPGYLALLPVLGTVAVIAAGETGRRDPLTHVIERKPVQVLGDISYSMYLWHWPGIVVLPFVLHRTPAATDKILLLAVCLGLAWLTKVRVEDPGRRWRWVIRPRVAAVAVAVSMLLVAATSGLIWHQVQREEDATLARLAAASSDPCFGAAALGTPGTHCADPFRAPATLAFTAQDPPWFADPRCVPNTTAPWGETCRFSDEPPTRTVALVGDSHATAWRAAVLRLAEELNWQVVQFLKGACPATDATMLGFEGTPSDAATAESCRTWSDQVDTAVTRMSPDYVFTSAFAAQEEFGADPDRSLETGARGFADLWTRWADRGIHVFVLRDIPSTGGVRVADCLALNPAQPLSCARPRSEAVVRDALTVAAERVASDRIRFVDLTDHFCDRDRCYAVVGGVLVYFDKDHMTGQFSRSLAPFLLQAIRGSLR